MLDDPLVQFVIGGTALFGIFAFAILVIAIVILINMNQK